MYISLSKLKQMVKSVVKEHTRKTKGGKIVQIRQHEDTRSKKEEQSSPVRITDGPHKGKEGFANKKELRSGKVKVMFRGVNMSGAYIKPEWVEHKADKEGKGKEKKTTMSSGLASIVKEVAKHDSFETAYSAFKHRTGIPREVADEFQEKFGEGGKLSPEKAFRNLYEHATSGSGKKEMKKSAASSGLYLIKSRSLHGRMDFQGLNISVENRKGSIRQWYDPHNKENGTTRMKCPYGYIRMTEGSDGDHVDCYVGPHRDAKSAYIVRQMKAPEFKVYDEQKCMLGFTSMSEAKDAYLAHYNDKRFLGSMTTMPMEQFKDKVFATKDRPGKIRKATTGLYLLKKEKNNQEENLS